MIDRGIIEREFSLKIIKESLHQRYPMHTPMTEFIEPCSLKIFIKSKNCHKQILIIRFLIIKCELFFSYYLYNI